MSKKDMLKGRINRPVLKRTEPVEETVLAEAVQTVADNPPTPSPGVPRKGDNKHRQSASSSDSNPNSGSDTAKVKTRAGKTKGSSTKKKQSTNSQKVTDKERVGEQTTAEPLKRLTIDLPQSLHQRVKLHSLQKGTSMREWIAGLIERELKK